MSSKVVMLLLFKEPHTWFKRIDEKLYQLTGQRGQQAGYVCASASENGKCSLSKHRIQIERPNSTTSFNQFYSDFWVESPNLRGVFETGAILFSNAEARGYLACCPCFTIR
jgi:hypothetical protein